MSIEPKKRVEVILRTIAGHFTTAADAIRDGNESKMRNWISCGLECLEPLLRSIEMLHPEQKSIIKKIQSDIEN